MEGEQQGLQFHQVLVAYGRVKDEPEEPDEEKGVEEACSEPHHLEAASNFRMFQGVDTDYLRALEEAIISLKLQFIMPKARATRAERKVEVITQEEDELAELLVRHIDNSVLSSSLIIGPTLLPAR
ncbi:unnamed protein product [Lactuca saligna]|uniref:Uncharacterized protein n=1 Tax=Lactuca saligna TaxID=75948 RepID=A0AA36E3R1_LACSI|nr:unnamed protein product [Lactuca saligna]